MNFKTSTFTKTFSSSMNKVSDTISKSMDDISKEMDKMGEEMSKAGDVDITANNGDIIITGKVRTLVVNGNKIDLSSLKNDLDR